MIVESGEWPWPFTKMEKSKSANGQIQKLAIHFEFGHSLILAIRWTGPMVAQVMDAWNYFVKNNSWVTKHTDPYEKDNQGLLGKNFVLSLGMLKIVPTNFGLYKELGTVWKVFIEHFSYQNNFIFVTYLPLKVLPRPIFGEL